jgi:hypothetical protein
LPVAARSAWPWAAIIWTLARCAPCITVADMRKSGCRCKRPDLHRTSPSEEARRAPCSLDLRTGIAENKTGQHSTHPIKIRIGKD